MSARSPGFSVRVLALWGPLWLASTAWSAPQSHDDPTPSRKRPSRRPVALSGTLNLNTASIETLDSLPGLGPTLAARIVERRQRSPFTKVDELLGVKGFGRQRLRELRLHLGVDGETTLHVEREARGPAPPGVEPGSRGAPEGATAGAKGEASEGQSRTGSSHAADLPPASAPGGRRGRTRSYEPTADGLRQTGGGLPFSKDVQIATFRPGRAHRRARIRVHPRDASAASFR